jgi:hypothetical protein
MDYFESAAGIEITEERAFQLLVEHGVDDSIYEFRDDVDTNERGLYNAQDVLIWLGY